MKNQFILLAFPATLVTAFLWTPDIMRSGYVPAMIPAVLAYLISSFVLGLIIGEWGQYKSKDDELKKSKALATMHIHDVGM